MSWTDALTDCCVLRRWYGQCISVQLTASHEELVMQWTQLHIVHCTVYHYQSVTYARVWSTLHVCGMDRSCATTTCSMRFVFNSQPWSEASRASSSCQVTLRKSSSASTTLVSPRPGRRFVLSTVCCLLRCHLCVLYTLWSNKLLSFVSV